MRKIITMLAVLAFSGMMLAQDASQQNQSPSQSDQATQSQSSQNNQGSTGTATNGTNGGQRMSGKVSSNGKTLTDDSGNAHSVSNPDALQNYENQHVVVLVRTDPDTGNITITAVQPPQ
jgi:hypothetical protein